MDECLGAVHNPNQLVPTRLGRHNDVNSGSRKLAVPKQNRFNMPAAPKASIGETLFGGGAGNDDRWAPAPATYESAAQRRKKERLRRDAAGMPTTPALAHDCDPRAHNIST